MSNYRAIIVNDTPADDIPSLLKAKAKLISNQNKGQGFYVIIGGWQGKTYGFSIGNVIGGKITIATVYKGNIIKNLIMDCQSYTKYRPNETTGGIFVSWRRKEELPTGA